MRAACGGGGRGPALHAGAQHQYLYFCTSKGSKVSTSLTRVFPPDSVVSSVGARGPEFEEWPARAEDQHGIGHRCLLSCVSVCTFVLGKQVN
jgi:hypothetical protein